MKTKLLLILTSAALAAPAMAQHPATLAHWDFVDGTTYSASLAAEEPCAPCIDAKDAYPEGLKYSWSTRDSEDGSRYGANCFGGWSANDCVIFEVDFANDAVAHVNEINFDVGNYGRYGDYRDINKVELRIWKNGIEITTDGQFEKEFASGNYYNPWTSSSDTTFDVSGLGIDSSNGSTDNYKFAIFVSDSHYRDNSRIALDNFRVNGHIICVPEPSSVALLGLGSLAMIMRRKR